MKLRTFLMIASVIGLVFALALLLVPQFMDTTYGTSATPGEILTDRFFGATLLAVAVITWLARDLTGASVRPVLMGGLIGEAVGLVVSLLGVLSGVMNATGWLNVALYLLLGLGFAYFQFMPPSKPAARPAPAKRKRR
jgi:preprotein translocase subunit SecY